MYVEKMELVCFIHSCTLTNTDRLDYLIKYITDKKLLDELEIVIVINIGLNIPVDKYKNPKILIINHSSDISLYENSTIKMLNFYSHLFKNKKLLYLHTKGIGYKQDHPYYVGVQDWIDFMLYSLVDRYRECVEILDTVQTVGVDYRSMTYGKSWSADPDHFSGNFWWVRTDYVYTLSCTTLKSKYDAEFWLFINKPTFINIHTCPYGHYENPYKKFQYEYIVTSNLTNILDTFRHYSLFPILYGNDNRYIDVSTICQSLIKDGILCITAGDMERNQLFTDPLVGETKYIKIGKILFNYTVEIRLPITFFSS